MNYTLADGTTFVDNFSKPMDQLPAEVRQQIIDAAARVDQVQPGQPVMCRQYAQVYTAWVNADDAQRPHLLARLRAHVHACGCRGIGGTWNPLEDGE